MTQQLNCQSPAKVQQPRRWMKLQQPKQHLGLYKVQCVRDRSAVFQWLSLPYITFWYIFFFTEISTPLTEPQTSRRPRFLTSNRSKRNAVRRCPKNVLLPGVSSLKGAHFHYKVSAFIKGIVWHFEELSSSRLKPFSISYKAVIYYVSAGCLATSFWEVMKLALQAKKAFGT